MRLPVRRPGENTKSLLRMLTSILGSAMPLAKPDIDYPILQQRYRSARSRNISLSNGIKLHYTDNTLGPDDNRPILVMIHGLLMDLHAWDPWHERLGSEFRIITLDLPGHGLTEAPGDWPVSIERYAELIMEVVERLELAPFTLIGNSMGGNVAWTFALRYPEYLDALVLIAATGWADNRAESQKTQTILNVAGSSVGRTLLRKMNLHGLVNDAMRDTFTPHEIPAGIVERYETLACASGHRDILLAIAAFWRQRHLASVERLSVLALPTLIMTGDVDPLVPPEHAYLFADAIKGSELIVYPRTGHVPMMTASDASANDLCNWLAQAR
ncbi:alpha/beta fold hydrolase [Phytohalomonas tamaricis]|uniref:alpha/beta fold hydrolase n=1 Tax=Phytohalomonas tamaricis TaxID=2081032 RepID=UPI00131A0B77|nr:alpha/beta fold hydrolase [Phytohalomonas tamaricis]